MFAYDFFYQERFRVRIWDGFVSIVTKYRANFIDFIEESNNRAAERHGWQLVADRLPDWQATNLSGLGNNPIFFYVILGETASHQWQDFRSYDIASDITRKSLVLLTGND